MKKLIALLTFTLLFGATSVFADTLKESYQAVLSDRDHFNSDGDRLTEAAAIIRQDRANYHKFKKRDQGDENDAFFASAENRALLEKMLNKGSSTKKVKSEIVNGTPTIYVQIFNSDEGDDYVVVTILE